MWGLFRAAPPPLGHDSAAIWPNGPSSPDAAVLRLKPWRVRATTAAAIAARDAMLAWRWTNG